MKISWINKRTAQLTALTLTAAMAASIIQAPVIARAEEIVLAGPGSIEASEIKNVSNPPASEDATELSSFEGSGISFETEALAQPIADLELQTADVSGDWRLILVNGKNQLPEDYWIDTAMVQYTQNAEIVFDYRAVEALDQFLSDCVNAGYWPNLRAAHRSHEVQQYLYQRKVQEWLNNGYSQADAEATAATIVALPGTSEHELGLAADITSEPSGYLNESEADAPVQQWLIAHCTDYGFVLRFPKGKEDITGIMYEPWHYRYVGKEAAVEMTEKGLCLEEYIEYKKREAADVSNQPSETITEAETE